MQIQHYQFGKITVDTRVYDRDLVLTNDSVIPDWRRKYGHRLTLQDISDALAEHTPDVLIIGTGKFGILKVPLQVKKQLQESGVRVYIKKTKKACELYNQNQNKKVMAALHINC